MAEQRVNVFQFAQGEHETLSSGNGEANLGEHFINCDKNPGHTDFIPLHTFSVGNLPMTCQTETMFELIKLAADLTVRVAVELTSPNRREFWPDTMIPYPFYKEIGQERLRLGSGRVWRVITFTDGYNEDKDDIAKYTTCSCPQCKHPKTPSHTWWEILILTAAHVVYDDVEAERTSLRLFYDQEDSSMVTVNESYTDFVNVTEDWCWLRFVTCNSNIGNKLQNIMHRFNDVHEKIKEEYAGSRDDARLSFIVSHPHGCAKYITVGRWLDKKQEGSKCCFTYTTCTCVGSSGATVYFVGYSGFWWGEHPLVHCGTIGRGINYSSLGEVF